MAAKERRPVYWVSMLCCAFLLCAAGAKSRVGDEMFCNLVSVHLSNLAAELDLSALVGSIGINHNLVKSSMQLLNCNYIENGLSALVCRGMIRINWSNYSPASPSFNHQCNYCIAFILGMVSVHLIAQQGAHIVMMC